MTSIALPPDRATALRAALRRHAGAWIARFYRHELLVARTVRGFQVEAEEQFTRDVIDPVIRRVAGGLATYDRRGVEIVADADPRLRAILDDVRSIVRRGVGVVERSHAGNLRDLVRSESEWVNDAARKVLRVEPPAAPTDQAQAATTSRPFLGGRVEEWFESIVGGDNGAADNVRFAVQQGIQRGHTVEEITRALRGRKATGYTDGLLSGQNVQQLRMLVRTSATHASATARNEAYKALGVQRWRFVATLDSKTSVQCAANDGQTFPLGEGPLPPLHPNCRSATVPDMGEPIGNRASIDGPVPATQTFEDWLGGRSREEQEEVLGKTRAAAWRAGDLTLRDMLGNAMQPLTLAELRRLDRIPDDDGDE